MECSKKCTENLTKNTGAPCDLDGYDIPLGAPPMPREERDLEDYSPFKSDTQFELAEFLYQKVQMSGGNIDILSQLIARLMLPGQHADSPWADHKEMYALIDSIQQGDIQ